MDCVVDRDDKARPLIRSGRRTSPPCSIVCRRRRPAILRDLGFAAKSGEVQFLPGPDGIAGAVCGLGDNRSPFAFGHLARLLPEGTRGAWSRAITMPRSATLGFCLGAYRYTALKTADRAPARLCACLGGPGCAGPVAGRSHLHGARPHKHARQFARTGRTG